MIVEAATFELAVIEGEPQRFDQMKRGADVGAQANDIAGVGSDLGRYEHDVQVHPHDATGHPLARPRCFGQIVGMGDTDTADFEGKVVAISGAASGMGAASAQLFAAAGATVHGIDIDPALVATSQHIEGSTHVGDIADTEFCQRTIDAIAEQNGRIDVLVNAAGTIHRADALGTSDEDFARVMAVNVNGTFNLSRAAVAHMVEAQRGAIVNFGSVWGAVGSAGVTAYCTSKGAVHQLTRAMALDHVEQGIRVNAVAPGEVRTPMLVSQRETPPSESELQALAEATIPMKRLAEPVEIARVVLFLASDAASYITGEIVHVDAGYAAR